MRAVSATYRADLSYCEYRSCRQVMEELGTQKPAWHCILTGLGIPTEETLAYPIARGGDIDPGTTISSQEREFCRTNPSGTLTGTSALTQYHQLLLSASDAVSRNIKLPLFPSRYADCALFRSQRRHKPSRQFIIVINYAPCGRINPSPRINVSPSPASAILVSLSLRISPGYANEALQAMRSSIGLLARRSQRSPAKTIPSILKGPSVRRRIRRRNRPERAGCSRRPCS